MQNIDCVEFCRALGDETRQRILEMLLEQEKSNREGKEGLGTRESIRPDGKRDTTHYSVVTPEEEERAQREEKEKMERALEILRNIIVDDRKR